MANFKNELNNYQIISRELIFDNTLSDRARFVYCYMSSKPDGWNFFLDNMAKEIGYNIDTLRKYINELIESGWLIKGKQENNGKFGAVEYTLLSNKKIPEISDTEKTRVGKIPTQREYRENIENIEKENKEGTNVPKKVRVSPTKEEREAFDMFRKKYPGQKRGLDTELALLIKKHKDWHDVIPILSNAIDVEIRKRKAAESANDFFPKPQMLQTYINQRSWEKYIDEINPNYDNEYRPTSNGGSVHWNEQSQCYYCFNPWDFYQFTDGYTNETRPDGAAVFCQGVKYTWSKEKKEWIQSR